MAHRYADRSAGRHREESLRRHRIAASTLSLSTPRGRAALLCATLGATLVTGLTGGTAASAAEGVDAVTGANVSDADLSGVVGVPVPATDDVPGVPVPATDDVPGVVGAPVPATDDVPGVEGSSADVDTAVDAITGAAAEKAAEAAPAAKPTISALSVRRKMRPVVIEKPAAPPAITDAAWVNPNPTATTTSCFGQRWGRLHAGVDLAAPNGTPIVAAGTGVVVQAGEEGGYGNAVLIDHGNGYLTHYGHLSSIAVRVGQHVRTGEHIGEEGSTGHSTGPHLHFEVHAGHYKNPVEPTSWLAERGVRIPGCG